MNLFGSVWTNRMQELWPGCLGMYKMQNLSIIGKWIYQVKYQYCSAWRKSWLQQDNTPCHKSFKTIAKLLKLKYELHSHPPHWLEWVNLPLTDCLQASNNCWLVKNFSQNEKPIAEIEASLWATDKWLNKSGIEIRSKYN